LLPNIALRRDARVVTTELGELPAGEILSPDWSLMGLPNAKRLPVLPVETSRGCPFNCAYCSEVTYWGKPVRYRGIDSVVAEIKNNVEKYGITTFRFTDSCFSAPPARAGELCDAIYNQCVRRGIPVKWSSYARVSNLDRTLLEKMKRSGCVALDIGVESGSERMLRSMGRHYSPSAAVAVAHDSRELGIITNFNVVIGFPGETRESVLETAALIDRAAPDTYSCFLFYLADHTRVHGLTGEYKLSGRGLCWQHSTMTSDEAAEGMRFIEKTVTTAANLPGGEYFACYLASLGFSVAQIQGFYASVSRMSEGSDNSEIMAKLAGLVESIRNYL
jgi:anaerobic magnesium-protoporphyrin IX monomethyl ester cyclase